MTLRQTLGGSILGWTLGRGHRASIAYTELYQWLHAGLVQRMQSMYAQHKVCKAIHADK